MPVCRCGEQRLAAQRREKRRTDQLAAVTALINRLDSTVRIGRVEDLIAQVTSTVSMQLKLTAYITTNPHVLISGGSRMPKIVAEFLYAAITAGISGLTSPACALCGQAKTLFHTWDDAARICPDCYHRCHTATCSTCGRERPIKARTGAGQPLCARCQTGTRQGECDGCGRRKALTQSTRDQRRYCRGCRAHNAPTEVCGLCGRERRVNARRPDGAAICTTCYAKHRPPSHICDQCGNLTPLYVRAGAQGRHAKNLCARCYATPRRACGICGRIRRISLKATTTTPDICPTCYQAPIIDCSLCGATEAGRRSTNNGQPLCFGCEATAKIDAILTEAGGQIPPQLKPIRDAIVDRDRPRSILSNMTGSTSLNLLADIAAGRIQLSHEALDEHGNGFAVTYLRSLLVATEALPARDENLTRLNRYAATLLDNITDTAERAVLARYARWHVIAKATPDRHGQVSSHTAHRCRDQIRTAQRFLNHLTQHDQNIGSCTQPTLDAWLAATSRHSHATAFIRWLARDGYLTDIDLPQPAPPKSPGTFLAEDDRWDIARRMLHNPTAASIEDRAAACLVLLYAQPAAKIAQLSTDDITIDPAGKTYLHLGPQPLLLIPPLDELITALPAAKPFGTAHTLADRRWLFAGKKAGHHIHPASMMRRLNQLGITTRTSRNTALLHLAATTPTAIFASLIGISIPAAIHWTQLAGSNWKNYTRTSRANSADPMRTHA